jgi:hypothetical protein
MFAIAVLLAVLACTWWFILPTMHFLSGFAAILQDARIDRSLLRFVSRRSFAHGRFGGRAVQLEITQPREHDIGHVVVSMEVHAPKGEPWKDSAETFRHPDISRATFDLEGKSELILTNDDGWLRAASQQRSFRFPGHFDPDRWRRTLENMQVLAEWLEKRR